MARPPVFVQPVLMVAWLIDSDLHSQTSPAEVATPDRAEPWYFKLSESNYNTQGLMTAQDINLRCSRQDTTWWVTQPKNRS